MTLKTQWLDSFAWKVSFAWKLVLPETFLPQKLRMKLLEMERYEDKA